MGQPFGVDTSSNNPHPINWVALYGYLKGLGGGAQPFAIIKVTQGDWYVNPDMAEDVAAARAAGFAVAGYLMDQGNNDPAAEVGFFKAHAAGLFQLNDDELPEGLSQAAYIAHTKELAALNSAPDYLNQSEENAGFPAGGGYWEADYNNRPMATNKPTVLIHQYTSSGVVPGCAGNFDLNVYLGSAAQFNAIFAGVVAPPVVPDVEASSPAPAPKVAPHMNIVPIPGDIIVDYLSNGTTTAVLWKSGAVYMVRGGFPPGAAFSPYGQDYWGATREAAQLKPFGVNGYTVIDTAGESYNYGN